MKKEGERENLTFKAARRIRNDWNGVNPVTRIVPNKKKYQRKKKHKNEDTE